ncbi:MAG: DNA repair protein RecO [Oscillospiraceae bacterium]|nr:DNA repair protein RecO [Oscillospiraceae bacterium]
MAVEKIKGLVIKTQNINENDKYITVLCEKYGKISFKAAGVRSFKNKNLTSAQPFAYSEFTIFRGQNFTRMNEAQVIENFYDLRLDVASLALASYFSEIAGIICVSESYDDGGVLRLLLNSLHFLSKNKLPRKVIKAVFELRVLTLSGFMPNLESCECCSLDNFEEVFFDVFGGNLICMDCVDKLKSYSKLIRVSRDILNALKFVTSAPDEKLFAFVLHDKNTESEFGNICEKYLLAQIDINIDSLRQYKNYEKY